MSPISRLPPFRTGWRPKLGAKNSILVSGRWEKPNHLSHHWLPLKVCISRKLVPDRG